jgi:CHASE2 domain-containing sensor protein/signal transduction histidine kinase
MRQMLIEWLAVSVLGAALAAGLVITEAAVRLDNVLYDAFVRRLERPASEEVLIVAIDDASLTALGPWPWPRAIHARLIARLTDAGVRAVGYDVLFLEPAPDPADDLALSQALARSGRVCLPVMFEIPGPNGDAFAVRPPPPPLRGAARLGHVDMVFDADGLSRRAVLYEGDGERRLPHLVECVRQAAMGLPPARDALPDGRAAERFVREELQLIPFTTSGGFRTVSAASVIAGEVPEPFLRDRLVLVGATAAGLDDRHSTPLSTRGQSLPGVEIEANILNARLLGSASAVAGRPLQLAFTLAGVALMMLALAVLPPRRALPFGFALLAVAVAASAAALAVAQVWLPPFALVVTVVVLFPIWGWRRLEAASGYMVDELQRFAAEPELLRLRRYGPAGGDTVARQIQLMDQTIARVRDLRRFASDTLRSLPDATIVANRQGDVLFANPAALRLARRSGRRGRRRTLAEWAEGWTDLTGAAVRMPEPAEMERIWQGEVLSPAGRPYLAAIAPHRDASGAPSAWILRLTNITELKAASAQREQIIQLLSHDMRAPQSSILALLETTPGSAIPQDLKQRLAGYARRTLALAGNFVHLARAGSNALSFQVVDLADVLIEAADELWPLAKRAGIRIDVETDGREHLVLGERDLLTRALVNLLDNAVKYSPAGSRVACTLARGRRGAAVVTVADQGSGMSADQVRRLFQPFQRFATGAGAPGGVGLGLSLVAQVVARHQGTITCRSAPGEGAAFTVSLPPFRAGRAPT